MSPLHKCKQGDQINILVPFQPVPFIPGGDGYPQGEADLRVRGSRRRRVPAVDPERPHAKARPCQ